MKQRTRTLLTVLLVAVFAGSSAMLLRQHIGNRQAEEAYSQAQQLASRQQEPTDPTQTIPAETEPQVTQPPEMIWVPAEVEEEDPHMTELAQLDLSALREVNEDVLGWIRIPGTKVDYPFLQGEDNEYYLKTTWDFKKWDSGSIFLECENSPDMTDFNTIVYGHNMNNGSMFASIRQYANQNYFEKHPYIYLLTDEGVWRYEIFSSYRASVESPAYGLSFRQRETRENFVAAALENSVIETGIVPELTDRILTLSTCSGAGYSTRWVVHGRLAMVEVEKT